MKSNHIVARCDPLDTFVADICESKMSSLFSRVLPGPWETGENDVQFRIEREGDTACLFFQCTVSKRDWMVNFDFFVKPYKDMPSPWFAHAGFVKGYKSVRATIRTRLQGCKVIRIVGYSQGAAYATLAHEDLWYTFGLEGVSVKTYAFGSPRVVWMPNWIVARRFDELLRVEAAGDIVTCLPPALFGYRHVGESIRLFLGTKPPMLPSPKHHTPENYSALLGEYNL